jgi:hypothetical protein
VDKSELTPLVEAGSKIDSNVLFIKLSDLMGKFG